MANLTVPDFTIFVFIISRNVLLVCLILTPLLSLSIFICIPKAGWNDKKQIVKEIKRDPGPKKENYMYCTAIKQKL